jgi:HEAT repeat protein
MSAPTSAIVRGACALAALAALVACSSSGGAAAPRGGRSVPTEELPERERALWQAWNAGGPEWVLERERARDDPRLAAFLVDNLVLVMVRAWRSGQIARLGAAGDDAHGPYERARAELVELADASTPVLVGLLRIGDGEPAYVAADVLRSIGAPALVPVTRLMDAERDEVRRRAAELVGVLPCPVERERLLQERLARAVRDDPDWFVRREAARSLAARAGRFLERELARRTLVAALADGEPLVVGEAARGLGELGDPRSMPALIDVLEAAVRSGDLALMRVAQAALRELSGGRNLRSPADWRAFWQDNRRKLLDG